MCALLKSKSDMSFPTLSFNQTSFEAAICLNGAFPDLSEFEELASIPLIAADGAANILYKQGVVPDFVVGDMDSITTDVHLALQDAAEFVYDPDQETNDFEKALRFAQSQLWNSIAIFGLSGLLLEHTLNNWSVLMKMAESMNLGVIDSQRIAVPMFTSFKFQPTANEILSILPQPLVKISTRGLKWNLTDAELRLGTREGARNQAVEPTIEIDIHAGSMLFFCDSRALYAPKLTD